MLKRELKINLKSFIIWTSILIGLFAIVYLVYPSVFNSDNKQMIDNMMEMLPQEMLKAFNMDLSSIETAYGWLKTEGFVFVLLISGIYSGILGSQILMKEENDKTIEYLNSLPITRSNIAFSKILCGIIYISLMILCVGVFNFIGLSLSGEFDRIAFILLSITPLFSSVVIFTICLFLSTFTHKTKKTIGISLGIVFAGYFLNIISEMGTSVEFLKYLSVFTLADIRNVIMSESLNLWLVMLSFLLAMMFLTGTFLRYNHKELV